MTSDRCPRCTYLEAEAAFWKDQQRLAASVAANIADLDEEAPALRQMLRRERELRKAAEHQLDVVTYRLQELTGELP